MKKQPLKKKHTYKVNDQGMYVRVEDDEDEKKAAGDELNKVESILGGGKKPEE